MKTDLIISNPPYSAIGVELAKVLPYHTEQLVYLGTPSMVEVNCHKVSADCVYIESYCVRGEHYEKLKWVSQTIWLAYPGKCKYFPKKTKLNTITSEWNIRVGFSMHIRGYNSIRQRNVLLNRNPKTSDILNCSSEQEMETVLSGLLEPPPYNHKAMLKYGFMAQFKNDKGVQNIDK